MLDGFRGHVPQCTDCVFFFHLDLILWQDERDSQVRDLRIPDSLDLANKDVQGFDVSVDDVFACANKLVSLIVL